VTHFTFCMVLQLSWICAAFWSLNSGLDSWGLILQYFMEAGDFAPFQSLHTGSGVHQASYVVGVGAYFPCGWYRWLLTLVNFWAQKWVHPYYNSPHMHCGIHRTTFLQYNLRQTTTSRCENSPAFQGLSLSPFQGVNDGLVKLKPMNGWPTVWCVDLCFSRVRDEMWTPLVSEWSREMRIESVPELLENFQTLAWPSAHEDLIHYHHNEALRVILLSFKSWTLYPLSGQDWSYRWSYL
jgi:hypothetical protein